MISRPSRLRATATFNWWSLAFATTVFTNLFNRVNDTEIDFPALA
jgi:hypothetical protein